ncbi:hypothetical protein K2173_013198 [Erythroxylum novogranatense]|uniref:DDE Tnp4 domain-containing protein n=1 Tax=Erythroxylum novogranatense TaxID=1862640 RepID=A0AAV8TGP0_9ROSI|nr:hypothetical protein K2173_013198 [Erythroxylum novogranatense]
MNRQAFFKLCEMLESIGGLKSTKNMLIDEQVGIFLHIIAHHVKNRVIGRNFRRSGETVSRCFHNVLNAVMHLQELLFKKVEPIPTNSSDHRWRWFKNCLGALDGTYIRVNVPIKDKARFRTSFDGDGRVLRDAITRRHGLKVPHGCYYLVDASYTNCEGFLAPFRGQRYHLNEWRQGYQPRTAEEFFNMKHASARNVIERCFGLLKIRWAILRSPSFYPIKIPDRIILACCLLHNFIRREMIVEEEPITAIDPTNAWTNWRIGLAREMFSEWQTSRQIEN